VEQGSVKSKKKSLNPVDSSPAPKSQNPISLMKGQYFGKSSEGAHDAVKKSGGNYIETSPSFLSADRFEFGGTMVSGKSASTIVGSIPVAWREYLDAPAPRKVTAKKIARFLTTNYFQKQGFEIKEARRRAAELVDPNKDAESAEREYRRAEANIFSRDLLHFNRAVMLKDETGTTWAFAAHETAAIEQASDGCRLTGVFWRVKVGATFAQLVSQDYFFENSGSSRRSGGTVLLR
jgi:hypothetical protein